MYSTIYFDDTRLASISHALYPVRQYNYTVVGLV